jgi:hypothetical protein
MALKIPPPPLLTGSQWQAFNRWLLELQSILSNQGGIDPTEVTGLPAVITQVGTNTTDIAALEGTTGGQGTAIATLNSDVSTIQGEIATINGQITTLESNPVLHNGTGVPNPGLGNVDDWYGDVTGGVGARIFIKTAVSTWTAFPF